MPIIVALTADKEDVADNIDIKVADNSDPDNSVKDTKNCGN